MMEKEKIYTHKIAADIVDMFDDLLGSYDIKIPSPEDEEREDDNEAALFGTVYDEQVDCTEKNIIEVLDKAGVENYVPYVFSGDCEKSDKSGMVKETVYTHDAAAAIVEVFEDLLNEHNIQIPPSDDQDDAGLDGDTYYDLLDDTEGILIDMLEEAGVDDYVSDEFGGTFDM